VARARHRGRDRSWYAKEAAPRRRYRRWRLHFITTARTFTIAAQRSTGPLRRVTRGDEAQVVAEGCGRETEMRIMEPRLDNSSLARAGIVGERDRVIDEHQ